MAQEEVSIELILYHIFYGLDFI